MPGMTDDKYVQIKKQYALPFSTFQMLSVALFQAPQLQKMMKRI